MYRDRKVYALITAAGKSRRMGFDKLLREIDGVPVIRKTALAFEEDPFVDSITVTVSDNGEEIKKALSGLKKVTGFVSGGLTRALSVMRGIRRIDGDGLVAVHDGARPFVTRRVIDRAIAAAYTSGGAVPCVPLKDTIKSVKDGLIQNTPDRSSMRAVQTPQVFDVYLYKETAKNFFDPEDTDDSSMFERAGIRPALTRGDYRNIKITTAEDLDKARRGSGDAKMRIGHGYDVHRLVGERKLILCGVEIPFEKGLMGHSDADVALHAIMDSALGARALGDIGKLFPDSDPAYEGADSMALAGKVADLIFDKGYAVGNIDATIICQRPKLSPYTEKMRENVARCFKCRKEKISIKATTEEGLGFTGEGRGIACHRVCLLIKER